MLVIIVKNEKPSFWNLGSNFLDFWQFFSNFLAFQWATFQHFTSTIQKGLLSYKTYMAMGRLRPKGVPFQASGIWKGCDFTSWASYEKLGKSVISVCSKNAQ